MKLVRCQVEVSPRGARLGQVKALGAWWVQFRDKEQNPLNKKV